ncbi:TPA: hypothetical protein QC285_002506 [Bacillus cereus]|uniref:Uncharacterized protein n=1 Tax=Bacillus cereus TaxID=1396 RepID=A0A9X7G8S7_BACCE|nr:MULTISPECIES: DUF6037 family protein [Bacillus cereus group]EKS8376089.1 hypothetical protein [Bacillus cereus]EKS8383719.1 hypothetical protein [Bacillus cereus]EMA7399210.1 hypothetical protein [Bacillus cereus]KGT40812.1 hypothetical protein IY08_28500 [Bacillus cereus]MDA2462573.1 DUF6037 family protein [Bacillus cereus]
MCSQKARLYNLKLIRDELKKRDWAVDAFLFHYKKREYIVLVKVYSKGETKDSPYAIVKLEFIKKGHGSESLCAYADLYKLHFPTYKSFREFFEIDFDQENLGDIIQQFTQYFSTFIPNQLIINKESALEKSITRYLNKSDSDGIYCFGVKRNGLKNDGTPGQRRPENNQKAELLRPELFKKLKDDLTISFCFSEDPTRETSDEIILLRWAERNRSLVL